MLSASNSLSPRPGPPLPVLQLPPSGLPRAPTPLKHACHTPPVLQCLAWPQGPSWSGPFFSKPTFHQNTPPSLVPSAQPSSTEQFVVSCVTPAFSGSLPIPATSDPLLGVPSGSHSHNPQSRVPTAKQRFPRAGAAFACAHVPPCPRPGAYRERGHRVNAQPCRLSLHFLQFLHGN